MVHFEIDEGMLRAIELKLKNMKKQAPNVLKMAVNDTARKTKTLISKEVRKEYIIKASDINQASKQKLATKTKPTATLFYFSPVLPVHKYFKAKAGKLGKGRYYNPTLRVMMTGKGGSPASVKLKKSSALTKIMLSENGTDLKAFIATMSSGHTGVFQRQFGKQRGEKGEIKELFGPSVPNMVYGSDGEQGAYPRVESQSQKYLMKRLNHHIDRVLASKK